ncbi:hypothetical protein C2857_002702 [Epichloe festucae Fl1]|uniref:Uncharacterized protein n=1 Tax=Epichloe festucae (strain Fl1) TaxID=877507 RepID=A0A7U3Q1S5_EPIFF|nr:hypothetical protein C2857_002702 [Epichloe festucae Fl1]
MSVQSFETNSGLVHPHIYVAQDEEKKGGEKKKKKKPLGITPFRTDKMQPTVNQPYQTFSGDAWILAFPEK